MVIYLYCEGSNDLSVSFVEYNVIIVFDFINSKSVIMKYKGSEIFYMTTTLQKTSKPLAISKFLLLKFQIG